jgi:hypothetical protein
MKLRLPRIFRNVDIFAVENIVDGGGTVQANVSTCWLSSGRSDDVIRRDLQCGEANSPQKKLCAALDTHLHAVPSLRSSSSSVSCRLRLAARDCAGDATAEFVLEAVVDVTRERALREMVLWLSRACLRRSRIFEYGLQACGYELGFGRWFVSSGGLRGSRSNKAVIVRVTSL